MAFEVTRVRSERRVHHRIILHMGSTKPCRIRFRTEMLKMEE